MMANIIKIYPSKGDNLPGMKKRSLIAPLLVGVCFLYAGSAYMSQFYRLMDYYDDVTLDIITSGWNYLLQALGILIFSLGLWKFPNIFGKKKLFLCLLATGLVFMALCQLVDSAVVILISGYIFQLHIGLYSGYYLSALTYGADIKHLGLSYGAAYAFGSVGTYAFSLFGNGDFLASKEITIVYAILAVLSGLLCFAGEDISAVSEENSSGNPAYIRYLAPIVAIMMVISVMGSGLYYSLPAAKDVDWNLIRAAYAIGLMLAGFLMDKKRLIGEICVVASLTYPLIAMALIGEGVNNTVALALSYTFRGFISVYYVYIFAEPGAKNRRLLPLAPMGLFVSRLTEAVLSVALMLINPPVLAQIVITALCFVPLLILFLIDQNKRYLSELSSGPEGSEEKLAAFSSKHGLTHRESEVLSFMAAGLSDSEIAEKCFISQSTVRFHVTNILKKTKTSTRVEAVRSLISGK